MSTITSVELQKKKQGRFNIFIDGQFAFGADEDLVVNRRLMVGKIINPEELEKILFEAEVGKLMERMYRWFSFRQHSEKEVRDYFRIKVKKKISQPVVDAMVETLRKKGMINDLEFAKAWVEARRRSKQKGIRAISSELFQKGINKEIIEEVLRLTAASSGRVSEEELAELALEKKLRAWKNLSILEFKKKALDFLIRRGFEYDTAKEVIEKNARLR